jgi:uncharacterized protein (DUF1778 family)
MPRNLRLDPDVESLVALAAGAKGQSINTWIADAVQAAILRQAARRGKDGVALSAELERRAGAKRGTK